MNERIKELAKQAHVYADGHSLWCHAGDVEKFAELIVRECASVVFKKTGPKSALNVLEHFGVEE